MSQHELDLLFKKCYKSNIPPLTQLTQSKEEAQEVYQEAFYILLKKWKQGSLQNQQNLCGYLFIIAKNKWLESKRKSKVVCNMPLPSAQHFDPLEAQEHLVDQEKRTKLLLKAMNHLSEKCRRLLTESIVYKVSLKTLQAELGYASYNAVKVAKHQCKKSLIKKYWKLEGAGAKI